RNGDRKFCRMAGGAARLTAAGAARPPGGCHAQCHCGCGRSSWPTRRSPPRPSPKPSAGRQNFLSPFRGKTCCRVTLRGVPPPPRLERHGGRSLQVAKKKERRGRKPRLFSMGERPKERPA